VFIAPLHINEIYSILVCIFETAGMCSSSSCLAMDVSFDFATPVFGRNVIILFISTISGSATNTAFVTKMKILLPLLSWKMSV
jgi:hypothetical protein